MLKSPPNALHSHFWGPGTSVSPDNTYRLDSPTSACNGTWVQDMDSEGSDYSHRLHTTQAECCGLCVADARCSAVVWNSPRGPYKDGGCNLKYSVAHAKPRTGQLLCKVRNATRPPQPGPPPPVPPAPPRPTPTSLTTTVVWAEGPPRARVASAWGTVTCDPPSTPRHTTSAIFLASTPQALISIPLQVTSPFCVTGYATGGVSVWVWVWGGLGGIPDINAPC